MSYHQVTAASLTPSRPAPPAPPNEGKTLYSTNTALANAGYSNTFTFTPASPSGSSYAFPYSGIGGTPNRGPNDYLNNSQVIRSGGVSMKEDGFGNWLWQRKWLVLKEQSLAIHKSEVRASLLSLSTTD
jgi:protein-serine/threonine kinase